MHGRGLSPVGFQVEQHQRSPSSRINKYSVCSPLPCTAKGDILRQSLSTPGTPSISPSRPSFHSIFILVCAVESLLLSAYPNKVCLQTRQARIDDRRRPFLAHNRPNSCKEELSPLSRLLAFAGTGSSTQSFLKVLVSETNHTIQSTPCLNNKQMLCGGTWKNILQGEYLWIGSYENRILLSISWGCSLLGLRVHVKLN